MYTHTSIIPCIREYTETETDIRALALHCMSSELLKIQQERERTELLKIQQESESNEWRREEGEDEEGEEDEEELVMGVEEEEEEGVLVRRCLREMQWKLM